MTTHTLDAEVKELLSYFGKHAKDAIQLGEAIVEMFENLNRPGLLVQVKSELEKSGVELGSSESKQRGFNTDVHAARALKAGGIEDSEIKESLMQTPSAQRSSNPEFYAETCIKRIEQMEVQEMIEAHKKGLTRVRENSQEMETGLQDGLSAGLGMEKETEDSLSLGMDEDSLILGNAEADTIDISAAQAVALDQAVQLESVAKVAQSAELAL